MPAWNSEESASGAAKRHGAGGASTEIEALGYGALWIGGSPSRRAGAPVPRGDDARSRSSPASSTSGSTTRRTSPRPRTDHRRLTRAASSLGHRHRPPRGDQRLHAPAEDDARVLRRPRRCRDARPPTSASPPRSARRCSTWPRERSLGTHPYFIDARAHRASPASGSATDALVAPEVAVVRRGGPGDGPQASRASSPRLYLGLTNYTNNLLKFGFTAAGHRRRRLGPPDRRRDPARQRRSGSPSDPRPPRGGRGPRLPPAARSRAATGRVTTRRWRRPCSSARRVR